MVLIDKLLPKLKSNGHRVLIFSQMVRCLDILEDYLMYRKYPFERLDGRIRGNLRQAAIDRYCKPDSDRFVFLLCTKAGGLGINLTAADTVIIYDSDWNPQNDLQAQARCHRIGQQKMVKVYRLLCRNTYEREMFDKASLKLGLDKAILQSMNTSQGKDISGNKQLTKKEIEDLLKKGAYGAIMEEDSAADKFCEEDIDQILERRTQVITLENEKGSTFSKASFASSGIRQDIDIDDPDFWKKWAKKAEIDTTEQDEDKNLVISEPRRRTQIKRYGHDENVVDMSDLESSSGPGESDEDTAIGVGRGRGNRKCKLKHRKHKSLKLSPEDLMPREGQIAYGSWARSECFKVERGLLTFGWGRWQDILKNNQFRDGWTEHVVEDCARVIILFCLRYYRGDDKIRTFIWELISPPEVAMDGHSSPSSSSSVPPPPGSVPRGKRIKTKRKEGKEHSIEMEHWSRHDKYDGDLFLESSYRKHLSRHANKVLLRVRMLYYIKHEIIGDLVQHIADGTPASALPIYPPHCDQAPAPWWDREADRSLVVGTYKHGYESYPQMRRDPALSFLARCGPASSTEEKAAEMKFSDIEDESVGGSSQPPTPTPTVQSTDDQTLVEEDSSKPQWPSMGDLNSRLRRVITSYQRSFKKEEMKLAQRAKLSTVDPVASSSTIATAAANLSNSAAAQAGIGLDLASLINQSGWDWQQIAMYFWKVERREKFEQIVRERERQRLEIHQKKWSRREEIDFYRTVSSFGVEFDKTKNKIDWTRFRALSRLDKKFDETITDYFRAFCAMCKRVCGIKPTEEEESSDMPVEPLPEDKARRALERLNLLSKIREVILPHPLLDERLKLCQPSADIPDWWIPGKHDKDLLLGVAKHGLGRSDYTILNDPELSFHEIVKKNLLAAVSNTLKTDVKLEKPEESIRFDRNQILVKLEKGEGTLQIEKISNSIKKENPDVGSSEVTVVAKEESQSKVESMEIEKATENDCIKMEVDENLDKTDEEKQSVAINPETDFKEDNSKEQDKPIDGEQLDKEGDEEMTGEKCVEKAEEKVDVNIPEGSNIMTESESCEKDTEKTDTEEVENCDSKDNATEKTDTEIEIKDSEGEANPEEKICQDTLRNPESDQVVDREVGNPTENLKDEEKPKDVESPKDEENPKDEVGPKNEISLKDEENLRDVENPKTEENLKENSGETQPGHSEEQTVSIEGEKAAEIDDNVTDQTEISARNDMQPSKIGVKQSFADSFDLKASNTDSVDKLKAMFPELEVMNRLPEIDAIVVNDNKQNVDVPVPFNRGNPSLIDSSIANIFTQSYQNPIKWPKDHALQVRLQHIVHCVERGEWPVSRNFSAYTVPEEINPEIIPKRESSTPRSVSESSEVITITTDHGANKFTAHQPLKRKRHIAIDVETERAKLHALLNSNLQASHLMKHSSPNVFEAEETMSEPDSRRSTPVSSSLQPPPAHQHSSPAPRVLSMPFDLKYHNITQTPPLKPVAASPAPMDLSSGLPKMKTPDLSAGIDLSVGSKDAPTDEIQDFSMPSKKLHSQAQPAHQHSLAQQASVHLSLAHQHQPLSAHQQPAHQQPAHQHQAHQPAHHQQPAHQQMPQPMPPTKSKLDDMLSKLKQRKNCPVEEPIMGKEKKRKKLDEIVLGLSASKQQETTSINAPNSIFPATESKKPPQIPPSVTVTPTSSKPLSGLGSRSAPKSNLESLSSYIAQAEHQNLIMKHQQQMQQLLQQQQQQQQAMKLSQSSSQQQRKTYEAMIAEINKATDYAAKHSQLSHESKVNKWLAEQQPGLMPSDQADFMSAPRRRRPRVDPTLLDWKNLTGEENVSVINRHTGKKLTGSKAPQLKRLAQWLADNPTFDIDPKWVELVKERGNLPHDLKSRLTQGDRKTNTGAGGLLANPQTPVSQSSSLPTSLASSLQYPSLASAGLGGLNPALLSGLTGLSGFDPKSPNPFFSFVPNLGALAGMGGLSNINLTNSLFANLAGLGIPNLAGMDASTLSDAATKSSSISNKVNSKSRKPDPSSSSKTPTSSASNLPNNLPYFFPNPSLLYPSLGLGGLSPFSLQPGAGYESLAMLNGGLGVSSASQSMPTSSRHKNSSSGGRASTATASAAATTSAASAAGLNQKSSRSAQQYQFPQESHLLESLTRGSRLPDLAKKPTSKDVENLKNLMMSSLPSLAAFDPKKPRNEQEMKEAFDSLSKSELFARIPQSLDDRKLSISTADLVEKHSSKRHREPSPQVSDKGSSKKIKDSPISIPVPPSKKFMTESQNLQIDLSSKDRPLSFSSSNISEQPSLTIMPTEEQPMKSVKESKLEALISQVSVVPSVEITAASSFPLKRAAPAPVSPSVPVSIPSPSPTRSPSPVRTSVVSIVPASESAALAPTPSPPSDWVPGEPPKAPSPVPTAVVVSASALEQNSESFTAAEIEQGPELESKDNTVISAPEEGSCRDQPLASSKADTSPELSAKEEVAPEEETMPAKKRRARSKKPAPIPSDPELAVERKNLRSSASRSAAAAAARAARAAALQQQAEQENAAAQEEEA